MQHTDTLDISNLHVLEKEFEILLHTKISSSTNLESWLKQQSQLMNEIDEQLRLHYIAFQCNTDDLETKAALDFDQKHVQPLVKRYQSLLDKKYFDSPFRLQLDSNYYGLLNKKITNSMALFHEKNIDLEVEEDELITRYYEITGNLTVMWEGSEKTITELNVYLQDSNRNVRQNVKTLISEKMLSVEMELQDILNKLIAIRHKKAKNVGLPNYRDYMFQKYERFDYSAVDCNNLAESIRKFVVPLQEKFHREQQTDLQLDTLRPWDVKAIAPNQKILKPIEKENELIEKSSLILHKLDPDFSSLLQRMHEKNYLDLESRKGKAHGGFCEYLPVSKLSFIFMNLTYTQDDVVVFLHEMGHSIHNECMKHFELKQYQNVPMESAELASMTMELFTMEYWDVFYQNKADVKKAKKEQLQGTIMYLPIILIIDQFQHWIYENPVHSAKERNEKFLELYGTYDSSIVNWEGYETWRATQWLSVLHIFEAPFYYIEYAIAQIGALQMYKQYKENPEQALHNYKKALALGSSKSLKEVYEAAGIRFDFSSETIKEVVDFVEKELALLEKL